MIIVSSRKPSSPTDINENTPIGEKLDVDISARDVDGNPDLLFGIDWETSRAAKQGVSQNKDVFIEYVNLIYTALFAHKLSTPVWKLLFIIIWFVKLLALRPLLAYCSSLG
jgi:hypothetical protein